MGKKKVIVDSDFLIALYKPDDSSHARSLAFIKRLQHDDFEFIVINLVVYESVTVISHKMGMEDARKFYIGLRNFVYEIIPFDIKLEQDSWSIFLKQMKKGTSFVDCANLAVIEKYKFDGILSYDKFYSSKLITVN